MHMQMHMHENLNRHYTYAHTHTAIEALADHWVKHQDVPSHMCHPVLQAFSGLVATKPASAVVGILRPWCYMYAKLSTDSNVGDSSAQFSA